MSRPNMKRWFMLLSLLFVQVVAYPASAASSSDPAIRLAAADTESLEMAAAESAKSLEGDDAYRLALFKMKGHLTVARSLLQVRTEGANYHLQQPIQEIFRSIEPELKRRDAPLTADTLVQLERAMDAVPQAALATIDSAASAIDGSFAQTGGMGTGSVLALSEALLRQAVALYDSAVVDNEVVDVKAYRSGRGLVIQAEALVRHASAIREMSGHDALLATVVLIRQAWPGINPPPIVFDPTGVAGRLEEAVAIMEDMRA